MPPGGPDDLRPPVVVATRPSAFEAVTDLSTEIRFEFDERISERVAGGALESAVSISPTSGDYRVSHGRTSLSVKLDGGLRAGVVYRVTLQPAISDLFGNTLADPFELVFTTGGEPVPTTLAGEVWDRVTGRPLGEAALVAIGADSLVHRSTADGAGIFAFRYLASGPLEVTAFEDRDRDGEVDSTEVQGGQGVTMAEGDTLLIDLPVVTPDTTAPNLTATGTPDSTTVTLLFDDFLAFEGGVGDVEVTLESDSARAPAIRAVFHEPDYVTWLAAVTDSLQRLDSIDAAARAAAAPPPARDSTLATDTLSGASDSSSAAVDTIGAVSAEVEADPAAGPPDAAAPADTVLVPRVGAGAAAGGVTVRRPPPSLPTITGSAAGPTSDGRRILPGRRLVLQLQAPLEEAVPYIVTVRGVRNLWEVGGGGGVDTLRWVPAVDSTALADSLAADSLAADSPGVDSLAPPDTGAVIDTLGAVGRRPGAER